MYLNRNQHYYIDSIIQLRVNTILLYVYAAITRAQIIY